jgi:hypothetical protein
MYWFATSPDTSASDAKEAKVHFPVMWNPLASVEKSSDSVPLSRSAPLRQSDYRVITKLASPDRPHLRYVPLPPIGGALPVPLSGSLAVIPKRCFQQRMVIPFCFASDQDGFPLARE